MLLIIYLIFMTDVVLDAVGDASRTLGRSIPHHFHEAITKFLFAIFLFTGYLAGGGMIHLGSHIIHSNDFINTQHLLMAIVFYVSFRFVFFDLIYNLVTGNPLLYIGTKDSSLYVNFFYRIAKAVKAPIGFVVGIAKLLTFAVLITTVYVLIIWFI